MEKQEGTVFNEAQLYILEIMSRIKDEQTLKELKAVVTEFFAKKVEKDLEILGGQGFFSDEWMEKMRHMHERTPYKYSGHAAIRS